MFLSYSYCILGAPYLGVPHLLPLATSRASGDKHHSRASEPQSVIFQERLPKNRWIQDLSSNHVKALLFFFGGAGGVLKSYKGSSFLFGGVVVDFLSAFVPSLLRNMV